MGKKKGGNNIKCQSYLNNKTRIKNKTRKLGKRLRNSELKEETKDIILKNSRIGRKKEGFSIEKFKCSSSKKENKNERT